MENVKLFKQKLRKKWLDYYKINQEWLLLFLNQNNGWSKCADGHRPHAYIILGTLTALDQSLVDWMEVLCALQPDTTKLIKALGLDFDPDVALKEIEEQKLLNPAVSEQEEDFYAEYEEVGKHLDEIRQSMNQEGDST